jgi:hypothetical protein
MNKVPMEEEGDMLKGARIRKMTKIFERSDMFITDESPSLPYENWDEYNTVHYGQVKLFISDLAFLNLFIDYNKTPTPFVVVIGAAPGEHFPALVKMFPRVIFHLYDPSDFNISRENMERISIHKKLFTMRDAESWSDRSDVYIISDLRVVTQACKASPAIFEAQVAEDMKLQQEIILTVNPVAASLKLRFPYVDTNRDGKMIDKPVEYLDGFVFKQPWAKQNTNETRLFPIKVNGKYRRRIWSSIKYQDQTYFHNRFSRVSNEYFNPYTSDITPIYENELLNDYDSTATIYVIRDYILKMEKNEGTREKGIALYRVIMDIINDSRPSGRKLMLSQLRDGVWKSSTRNFNHKGFQPPSKLVRPLSSVVSTIDGGDRALAPDSIEVLM